MLTDTHCHLADAPLACRLPEIFAEAKLSGVSGMIVPATQPSDWQAVLDLQNHEMVRAAAVGVHPWFAADSGDFAARLAEILAANPRLWVGESGLDALADVAHDTQLSVFEQQLELARQFHRPIIVHQVRSTAAVSAVLRRYDLPRGGIIHAFSGSLEEAKSLIKLNFKIGIGSLLFHPNAKKARRAAAELPLSAIVLETDSPYMLANQAVNTPANVRKIAEMVAQWRGMPLAVLAAALEQNVQVLLE